ncbi:hypothetical protein [Marilutibacter spongiae]|uniref:Uncharacterized protein n=1 Tax=Marilutibacter spongiae TaxID=2025720 RepID=A0A7W3TPR1_9GAMM|nr:hypothetical protein [Lysobacter spongiae]MBB1061909.1 hypothetical protein [Lysobacter spongiae]
MRLQTPDRGKLYVMGFARQGMQGAQPRFALWGHGERGRRGGIMHDFADAGGADHPDARLIATAPDLYAFARSFIDKIDELDGEPGPGMRWQREYATAKALIAQIEGGAS